MTVTIHELDPPTADYLHTRDRRIKTLEAQVKYLEAERDEERFTSEAVLNDFCSATDIVQFREAVSRWNFLLREDG